MLVPVAAAASPFVPLEQQTQMKGILEQFGFQALAYVPTKAPPHYTYLSNVVSGGSNRITLANGPNQAYLTVTSLNGKLSACNKGSQLKLALGSVTVYSKGGDVWRCVTAPGGSVVKLDGSGHGLSRADIATIVVSAKRIS